MEKTIFLGEAYRNTLQSFPVRKGQFSWEGQITINCKVFQEKEQFSWERHVAIHCKVSQRERGSFLGTGASQYIVKLSCAGQYSQRHSVGGSSDATSARTEQLSERPLLVDGRVLGYQRRDGVGAGAAAAPLERVQNAQVGRREHVQTEHERMRLDVVGQLVDDRHAHQPQNLPTR